METSSKKSRPSCRREGSISNIDRKLIEKMWAAHVAKKAQAVRS